MHSAREDKQLLNVMKRTYHALMMFYTMDMMPCLSYISTTILTVKPCCSVLNVVMYLLIMQECNYSFITLCRIVCCYNISF